MILKSFSEVFGVCAKFFNKTDVGLISGGVNAFVFTSQNLCEGVEMIYDLDLYLGGLYYKHITIVNDGRKRRYNLWFVL